MKLTHRFAQLTPEKRPQDPDMDGTRAMTKAVLTAGVVFCLSAAAMAKTNISKHPRRERQPRSPQRADKWHAVTVKRVISRLG
jgi:hypothetical protein